ncbi:MAG: hypothetical protein Q8R39_03925 [bacterium]|nr:hypothetical protein [bacterium]MDZ4284234.1 hypothetical protein [Patescibacteria group bacterium]
MRQWRGEANGNTFLILWSDQPSDLDARLFLDKRIRKRNLWNFDSALVLTPTETDASVAMTILERDGTVSTMCGNGARVVGELLRRSGLRPIIETHRTTISLERSTGGFWVPIDIVEIPTRFENGLHVPAHFPLFRLYSVLGEPHAVTIVRNVWEAPLAVWGTFFSSNRINCTVVHRDGGSILYARTFERGVGAETRSCGTGACAAAWLICKGGLVRKKTVEVKMHEHMLTVFIDEGQGIFLKGSAPVSCQPTEL